MQNQLELFIDYLRVCTNCGHPLTVRTSLLCKHCYQWALKDCATGSKNVMVGGQSLKLFSTFDWEPGSNNALSCLIRSLKGGNPQLAWNHYAARFLQLRMQYPLDCRSPLLIPSPAKHFDHARQFCESLSRLSGIPQANCLQKSTEEKQRTHSLHERSRRRLVSNENFTHSLVRNHHLIFVDDVVTSGFTALSALSALNANPQNFEVWCLAYRRKSCS
jgi:predicted amidophosphoribosyltransferase